MKTDIKQIVDLAHASINRIKELEHRLAMIKEDSIVLQQYITANGLDEAFQKPTEMSDDAWTHFANIDIACDLKSTEALDWKPFNK